MTTYVQMQIKSLEDEKKKMVEESNAMKKEVETKNLTVQMKAQTVTENQIIVHHYKTHYQRLKLKHEKVRACNFCIVQSVLLRLML